MNGLQQTEQVQQPAPQPIMPPMAVPLPSGPSDDFFKYRIDGNDILEELEHQLKGEVYDHAQGKYVNKFDSWVNDEGIFKVLHIVYSCGINKNIFLGNLTKEEILFKCRMLKKKLALLLFKKYIDFEVKKEMRDLLITSVINTVHSGLSRSEDGKESDQISVAAQRYEVFQHQQQQSKSGILNKFPFMNRRGN